VASYWIDRAAIGYRFTCDTPTGRLVGWRLTLSGAKRVARRRLTRAG